MRDEAMHKLRALSLRPPSGFGFHRAQPGRKVLGDGSVCPFSVEGVYTQWPLKESRGVRDYNEERPHSAIGNKVPIELVNRSGADGPP
jgi:transposase InsO family protein